eukprot:gene3460-biopygen3492
MHTAHRPDVNYPQHTMAGVPGRSPPNTCPLVPQGNVSVFRGTPCPDPRSASIGVAPCIVVLSSSHTRWPAAPGPKPHKAVDKLSTSIPFCLPLLWQPPRNIRNPYHDHQAGPLAPHEALPDDYAALP